MERRGRDIFIKKASRRRTSRPEGQRAGEVLPCQGLLVVTLSREEVLGGWLPRMNEMLNRFVLVGTAGRAHGVGRALGPVAAQPLGRGGVSALPHAGQG